MQIDERQYLDFSDVLIKPKRSTLTSRSEVDINRTFKCKHSGVEWTGVPIIAANMDTIATFEMAEALSKHNMLTAIHKHYSIAKWQRFIDKSDDKLLNDVFVSSGISDDDLEMLNKILSLSDKLNKICLDVANGYTERFVAVVKKVRAMHPDKIIMAGNIVTYEMTEELLLAGASIAKGGIGGGCFAPEEKVVTNNGLKCISDVLIGDEVLTHKNRFKTVTNKMKYYEKDVLISINGINSTLSHKYCVVLRRYQRVINRENVDNYILWVPAKNLNENEHLLVKYEQGELSLQVITSKKEFSYLGEVFDLEVNDDHSFNINGVIVHNSACTTRKMTGVGMPQLSMIIECADAAHGLDGLLCSDGGCTVPGDVVKAFAAGADFVMIGGMLSGHKECAGDLIEENGELYKLFYGMSSKVAIEKHYGGIKNYRAEEGKAIKVPYKGEVEPTIIDILGGLRSACTYIGAKQLKNLSKRTTFIRVNNQLNGVFS